MRAILPDWQIKRDIKIEPFEESLLRPGVTAIGEDTPPGRELDGNVTALRSGGDGHAWAVLDRRDLVRRAPDGVWAAVPVTVVWANLHASVFLAPAIAVLLAAAAALRDRRWSDEVRRRAALRLRSALPPRCQPRSRRAAA